MSCCVHKFHKLLTNSKKRLGFCSSECKANLSSRKICSETHWFEMCSTFPNLRRECLIHVIISRSNLLRVCMTCLSIDMSTLAPSVAYPSKLLPGRFWRTNAFWSETHERIVYATQQKMYIRRLHPCSCNFWTVDRHSQILNNRRYCSPKPREKVVIHTAFCSKCNENEIRSKPVSVRFRVILSVLKNN